jgi:ABC-2 type transport system ATP-binding protein
VDAISLENVTKSYESVTAVSGVNLRVRQGGVLGLLGPNGAGKTTTIRMVMNILVPDEGSIRVMGQPVTDKTRESIGYLPEERGLYQRMGVRSHIVFLGALRGLSETEASRRAGEWLDRFGLGSWSEKKVADLSKGMQQKVQFIAALLHDPELLILDEPFAGLDPANAVGLKDVLLEMKKAGKTILFSTHRMDQVEKMCDAICLINHGKPVLQGELKQIKARYGKNNVQIEYEGDGAFLKQTQLVASYNDYGNQVELRLAPGADPQELLRLVASHSRVSKFELMEPSLEEIFIEVVGKNDA